MKLFKAHFMAANTPLTELADNAVSWDDIFARIDAAKEADGDLVGKPRASKPVGRSKLNSREPMRRPLSSRSTQKPTEERFQQEMKNRRHLRVKARGYRLAVRHADLFDTNVPILRHKNFGTWDQNRCHLPERLWPCQGAVGTLYDEHRRDKVEWKRGMPRGRDFGMALADVGTGTAAEAFIAKYVRRQRHAWSEQEGGTVEEATGAATDESLFSGRRTTVRWVGGRPVQLEFGV
ncbi:unnamed protein product [Durusdinium trenchii]|uniref:Uncharacterized protein n=1 Tax=Durusdinium trenchii TaxID=1381693 RepID=A0ABP0RHY5_9DINO